MSGVLHALTMTSSTGAADPLLASNVLLLKTIGTNNATNASFVDSSSNNFTVTRTGDVTQGSFSPYAPTGYWSNYFDGSGDRITVADNTALNMGTGDFTWEAWFYAPNTSGIKTIMQKGPSTGAAGGASSCAIMLSGNQIVWAGGTEYTCTATFSANTWNHIAVTRTGGSVKFWLNGAAAGTFSDSVDYTTTGSAVSIGDRVAGHVYLQYPFDGYISNVRIVKGTAVYTANFTPPTTPLTAISGTSLLTCQDNRFIDRSSNNFTLTRAGDVSVRRFAPFGLSWDSSLGGSGYFDGSGDQLNLTSNQAWAFGTGAYCIEMWVYPLSWPSTTYAPFIRTVGGANGFIICNNGGQLIYHIPNVGDVLSASLPAIGQWSHIVVCRNSTTVSMFVNGARVSTTTSSHNQVAANLVVGGSASDWNTFVNSYISGLRIVKGSSVYDPTQTTLTVPTSPLTAISGTSLLLNFDNAAVYDATRSSNLTLNGTTQTSTAQKNYADTSVTLSTAAGNRGLQTVDRPELRFGTGDFTAELWWRPSGLSGYRTIINKGYLGTGGFVLQTDLNNGRINVIVNGSVVITAPANRAVTDATWNHIALVRSAGTVTLWVNGLSAGSVANSANLSSTADLQIGWENQEGGNQYPASGNVEDVRVSRTARYTSAFTPPTRALPVTAG